MVTCCTCLWPRCTWSPATLARRTRTHHCIGSAVTNGTRASRKAAARITMLPLSCSNMYARRAGAPGDPSGRSPGRPTTHSLPVIPRGDRGSGQLRSNAVVSDIMQRLNPWTGWSVATWVLARPKSQCARRSWQSQARQVAVLVPTTLLAQQHNDTFKDRFADWPIAIEFNLALQDHERTAGSHREVEGRDSRIS